MDGAEKRDFQFAKLRGGKKESNLKYYFWSQGLNKI